MVIEVPVGVICSLPLSMLRSCQEGLKDHNLEFWFILDKDDVSVEKEGIGSRGDDGRAEAREKGEVRQKDCKVCCTYLFGYNTYFYLSLSNYSTLVYFIIVIVLYIIIRYFGTTIPCFELKYKRIW